MKKLILFLLLLAIPIFAVANPSKISIPKQKPIFYSLSKEDKKEVHCLTTAIFFEARGEPIKGQIAVGMSTMNRAHALNFPDTVCNVIAEKSKKRCQYDWYCNSVKRKVLTNRNVLTNEQLILYNDLLKLAVYIYRNYGIIKDPSNGAVFFHSKSIKPNWKNNIQTASIGNHNFYKSKKIQNLL